MVVKITRGNIRKQPFRKIGNGGPTLRKDGAGGPRIGTWQPPPFIGNWGDKQYGANVWFLDPLAGKKKSSKALSLL